VSKSGPILNLPNYLSFARLGLLPAFLILASRETEAARIWLFVLGALAILSDVLDGYLARKLGQVTEFGKILDPLSDKIITAALTIFALFEKGFPFWLGGVILGRDVLILGLALLWRRKLAFVPASNLAGKLTALAVALVLMAYILDWRGAGEFLVPVALGLVLFSSAAYGWRFLRQLGRSAGVRTGGA
jgi:CDP-diacylglycerol--glycerol-3-phosphate 3-phosphatidyltransferase